MNLELHLLVGALKDRGPNVLSAISTQIDHQQCVFSFDKEPADFLTLEE